MGMLTDHLVERDQHLENLREVVLGLAGNVVLLSGEAGFGKTSLLKAALKDLDHRHQVLEAACEPVGIPAAFAPLFDLLDVLPDELRIDIRSGSGRPAVYAGMLDLIKNDNIVLIFEDVHWADESTLGLIRYLGRRIEPTNSTMVVTYRSEELDQNSPLRLVVADLGPSAARIELKALTAAGVAEMARGFDVDPDQIYASTLGNPFFVEEIIRHPGLEVPPTVQNAVLAISSQLPDEALEVLYMVALSPEGLDPEVVARRFPDADDYVDMALQRRLLVMVSGRLTCRHDLIRESLGRSVPASLNRRLHKYLLNALEDGIDGTPDVARLAHHSLGAGDNQKALRYSLQSARDAARGGAHRQAAFHYANAIEFGELLDVSELGNVLLEAALEHNAINDFEAATDFSRRRVDLASSPEETARARAWIAFFEARQNDLPAARHDGEMAAEVLGRFNPGEELALALAVISWVELVEGNMDQAIATGEAAVETARSIDATSMEVYAATTVGTAQWLLGDPDGFVRVEEASRLGIATDGGEFAARAINNLGVISLWAGQLEEARRWFQECQQYAISNELDAWYIAATATLAHIFVLSGRWDDADRELEIVADQKTCFQTEIETLQVAATLRMRRGDPGAVEKAEAVLTRLEGFSDHGAQVSGCAIAMEGAWIGILAAKEVHERYERIRKSPALRSDRMGRALLTFWANRLAFEPPRGRVGGPVGLELDGHLLEASAKWEKLGFHVEAAITRAIAPGTDLEPVFAGLRSIGAEGVILGLRRELQRRGVKKIPRGQRVTTKENPAGLTSRESEVLGLIAAGMSNAAIAEELFISQKTASHHVSSVLAKLNVPSRVQAASLAMTRGWLDLNHTPT